MPTVKFVVNVVFGNELFDDAILTVFKFTATGSERKRNAPNERRAIIVKKSKIVINAGSDTVDCPQSATRQHIIIQSIGLRRAIEYDCQQFCLHDISKAAA